MKNITNTERILRHFWLEERKNYIAYVDNYTTKELPAYEEACADFFIDAVTEVYPALYMEACAYWRKHRFYHPAGWEMENAEKRSCECSHEEWENARSFVMRYHRGGLCRVENVSACGEGVYLSITARADILEDIECILFWNKEA